MNIFFVVIVLAAWLAGIVVSFINGNRTMPLVMLLLGTAAAVAAFTQAAAPFGVAGLAILSAILWIANKADM